MPLYPGAYLDVPSTMLTGFNADGSPRYAPGDVDGADQPSRRAVVARFSAKTDSAEFPVVTVALTRRGAHVIAVSVAALRPMRKSSGAEGRQHQCARIGDNPKIC